MVYNVLYNYESNLIWNVMGTLYIILLKYWDEVGRSWDEVGTTLDDNGTKFVELSKKHNPEVIEDMTKHPHRRREAPPRGVFAHWWSMFDRFGIVFRRNLDKFRTVIVKFVPTSCQ